MFKSKKGITLIALIITIIVLLILAGVTINMVMGDNGLINKAKTSVGKYDNSYIEEERSMNEYEQVIDSYNRETITITTEQLEQLIDNRIQNYMNDNNKFIVEKQTKTVTQYAEFISDSKNDYQPIAAAPASGHYIFIQSDKGWFRVFNGAATTLNDSNCIRNTSVTAYVLYVKKQ